MADESFASTGLSSSYAFLLMTVNDKPGIQPKEISEQMMLTPSTVTRLIERMEYRGLLERKHVGRTTEVYPTQLSLDLDPKIKEAWMNLFHTYSKILGEEEGKLLTSSIFEALQQLE